MNNQKRKLRVEIIDININETTFYPCSIEVNKWSCSCNKSSDPYSKLCVFDAVKNVNIKVFNLMSRNKACKIQHKTCKCKCKLNTSICNNKQRWNNDKSRFACK